MLVQKDHRNNETLTTAIFLMLLAIVLGILTVSIADAQGVVPEPRNSRGTFKLSELERISLETGKLTFSLPIASLGGRGLNNDVSLKIEQTWRSDVIDSVTTIHPDPYAFNGLQASGGGFLVGTMTQSPTQYETGPCSGELHYHAYWTDFSINFTTFGGQSLLFKSVENDGQRNAWTSTSCQDDEDDIGDTFVAWDGSGAKLILDDPITVDSRPDSIVRNDLDGVVRLTDGTTYRIDDGLVVWVQDRNGNRIEVSSIAYGVDNSPSVSYLNSATDSLNRTVEVTGDYPAPGVTTTVSYKGTGGTTREVEIVYDNMGDALRSGESLQSLYELFPDVATSTTDVDEMIVKQVDLPNGQQFNFQYNAYGELARVELPTGGAVEYDYESLEGVTLTRRLTERRVYEDGSSLTSKTVYDYSFDSYSPPGSETWTTESVYDGSNNLKTKTKTYFHSSYGTLLSYYFPEYSGAGKGGRVTKVESYDTDGTTLLRKVENTYAARTSTSWTIPDVGNIAKDFRLTETKTTLSDTNQVSTTTYSYNGSVDFNLLSDIYEYDFGSGSAGSLIRRTHIDYETSSNYTGNSVNLRTLPTETWVSSDSGGSTKLSRTQFEYDNYTSSSPHAALTSRSNVTGHDTTNYGTGFTYRGNVTAVTRYADAATPSGGISTYSQYDILGNVVKAYDGNGNATIISYSDNFGSADSNATTNSTPSQITGYSTFAFPTSTTNPLSWTSYIQYDYFTGQMVNAQDVNGIVSKTIYNDALDRPTQTVSAIGTANEIQTSIEYDDANRRVEKTSDLFTLNDNLARTESYYDGLGRTVETRDYKDGDYVSVKTEYDALGRVYRTSNPYRPSRSESLLWTTSTFDALGRVVSVETPDGAEATTSYSGNAVTVTDQAGKLRRSITNALGWLTRVDEPNSSNQLGTVSSPNQPTNYYYNTLGLMVRVNQGDQNRYFMYDSLGRTLRVKQPEQSANSALNTSGNPDNNSWSIGMTYDNNGNVLTTTDAKDTTVTFTYDELSRVETKTYEDGTPTVTFYYDGAGLSSVPDYSKGKTTKVSNSLSESKYTQFDVMGRVLQAQQITDGTTYTSSYEYTLAGDLKQEIYPISGRVVKTSFDGDGQISRIYGQATSSATERTYANTFMYMADGRIEKLRLGNGLWEAAKINNRLQVTEFLMGHGSASGDLWKHTYEYGELQTNGTVDTSKNNGDIGKQTLSYNGLANPFVQTFKYDSLSRLTEAKETNNSNQTWKQGFGYDRYGNRTSYEKYSGSTQLTLNDVTNPGVDDDTNHLLSTDGYTFDENGNMTVDAEGRQFTFDGNNKQTEVKDDQDTTIGHYYYDGEGRRVKKATAAGTTIFVYSLGRLIAEYSTETPASNPTTSYTVTDQLGSPRVIVNAWGAVVSRRDFMPFGEEIAADGTYRTTTQKYGQTDRVRQKFTGYQKDEETGLDFAEARMYQNLHGRFTAIDPLLASGKSVDPQTFNRYVYVMNRPLILTDSTGLQAGKKVEKKEEEIRINTEINKDAPRLEVNVKYLDKDAYGTAVPIGGEFQIISKFLINKPADGVNPGDYAVTEPVDYGTEPDDKTKAVEETKDRTSEGTLATAKQIESSRETTVTVKGAKNEAVEVTKVETYRVLPRSNMDRNATGAIGFKVTVTDPQVKAGKDPNSPPKTVTFSTEDRNCRTCGDKRIEVRNVPVRKRPEEE